MPRHITDSWRSFYGPGLFSSLSLALATAILGLGLPVAYRLRQVLVTARRDERQPADIILVLGRALAANRPTDVFVARLDHAADLLAAGFAPRLMIAGGLTGKAEITEAAAGRAHLLARGLDPGVVLCEEASRHTLENLANVRETLRQHGWQRAIVVSDPLHLARVVAYAGGFDLDLLPSPAVAAPPRRGSFGWWRRALKEAFFVHWYHAGFLYSRLIRSRRLLERVT